MAPSSSDAAAHGWSQLPTDLAVLILERLATVDYIRFGAVCGAWNSVVKAKLFRPAKQIPWLMFPAGDGGGDSVTHIFFDPSTKKSYKMCLPEIHGRQCVGASTDGRWVVYVGHDLELGLLNLRTREKLSLPSIHSTWNIRGVNRDAAGREVEYIVQINRDPRPITRSPKEMLQEFYTKVIVFPSASFSGTGPPIVAFVHGRLRTVSVARVGDEAWTRLECPFLIMDIVLHRGRLCAVTLEGNTVAWTLSDPSSFSWSDAKQLASPMDDISVYRKYLLPLTDCSDEVFQVWRDVVPIRDPISRHWLYHITSNVRVFKLDLAKDTWTEVKNLGGHAFFFGFNYSIVLSGKEIDFLRGDCIYFTDDWLGEILFDEETPHGVRDVGVFDLEAGTWEPLPLPSGVVNFPSPIWVDSSALLDESSVKLG